MNALHPIDGDDEQPSMTVEFTLLYDSKCPFCKLEVEWLQKRDSKGRLGAIDITAEGFDAEQFNLSKELVHARLHGVQADGTVLEGMVAIRAAWSAAGLGWLMAPTGWPVLRWFADLGYIVFARYRVPLGRLFGRRCNEDACSAR